MVKKIGILTSGGDCAGLNAVNRAVTLRAISEYGWKVYGLKDGTLGLMKDPIDVVELKAEHFDGNLMTNKGNLINKLKEYEQEHSDLDQILIQLQEKHTVDFLQIQRLKKRKLVLKDRITNIKNDLEPDSIA